MLSTEMERRRLLRGTGVGLALPLFESVFHSRAAYAAGDSGDVGPRRMVCICRGLGVYGPDFFPKDSGRGYSLSPYLRLLQDYREQFTVVSGISHPSAGGGHAAEVSFLTGAPHAGAPSFKNSVSVDQVAAEHVGNATRFPFLALATHKTGISSTRNGVQIPPQKDPSEIFRKLFMQGTPEEVRRQEERLQNGQSILDSIRSELSLLEKQLPPVDRDRMDQYTTAVRDVEQRLNNSAAWLKRRKPQTDVNAPGEYPPAEDIVGRSVMMYDLMLLALQSDSTRVITLMMDQSGGGGVPPIEGVSEGRHGLSHHGMDPIKIEQLRKIEVAELKAFAEFLGKLQNTKDEAGAGLLDRTMVLHGSNMGNASSHDTRNLPILIAGGGFRHGQHLAFDRERNVPLSNLFASMLQRFGVEVDAFSSGTGTLTGLEIA